VAETPDVAQIARELQDALAARIDARDRAGALELALRAVHDGRIGIADLYTLVLGPYLERIGSQWQHGTERVWQEHLVSHAVTTIVESLAADVMRRAAETPRLGRRVLLACPPKEQHELGARMLADRFELAGWDTTFLGADTPLAEIVGAAKATGADLVCLSVSTLYTLRFELPGCRIVVGGPAFAHDRDWPAEDLLDTAELGLPGTPPGA